MRGILLLTLVVVVGLAWWARPASAEEGLLELVETNVALRAEVDELNQAVATLQTELAALRSKVGQRPASATLRQRIAAYRRGGGVPWYVSGGDTSVEHLIKSHGWSAVQLRGLTASELNDLHGASHTGRISPSEFGPRSGVPPEEDRVTVTVRQPARAEPRGRWVRRCIDGQCRLLWEPDD